MSADPEVLPKSDFRQGRRVARNVYHGDETLFMAATDELAAELVTILNAGAAALRAPQNDGGAAMREACAVECEEVSNERWGNTEKFVIKGLHDKATVESGAVGGARECAERIRALPLAQPDPSQEPGTGGERA